jgi:hypothetical protein
MGEEKIRVKERCVFIVRKKRGNTDLNTEKQWLIIVGIEDSLLKL